MLRAAAACNAEQEGTMGLGFKISGSIRGVGFRV